ncbi:hypothetical protein [Allokutzneria albata]|uniref:hypothetical protein n=1 Tax=Allokutzneria albata TaxID=211114 RepID=UPI0012DCA966|nr:hypothetical protein [Allokutzneria albata]
MSAREDAHRLVDALPEDRVPAVLELLRREIDEAQPAEQRQLSFLGIFRSGQHDVAAQSSEILRQELGDPGTKSA